MGSRDSMAQTDRISHGTQASPCIPYEHFNGQPEITSAVQRGRFIRPTRSFSYLLCLFFLILCSCSSSDHDPSSGTGDLSISLKFPRAESSSVLAVPGYKSVSENCGQYGISLVDARVYDEGNELLTRGGFWSCSEGEGSLRGVKPGKNRSVYVNISDDSGRLVLTGSRSDLTVVAGRVTEAVIEINLVSSEEFFLDALNDKASVNRGGTVTVLDSGYTSVLSNDLAPDSQSLSVNTAPVSPPMNGSVKIYPDGTFRYVHNGGPETSDSFIYEAKDAHGGTDIARVDISITPESNHAPELSAEGLSPATGGTDTTFTFSVHYSDADGHAPAAHHVYIDGRPMPMTLSAGDNHSDGTYTFSTTLPAGRHAYYFSFSDGHGGSARLPSSGSSSGLMVTGKENHAPIIENATLSPAQGTAGTVFTYSIHYYDQDGDTPGLAQVYIDGVPHPLALVTGKAWDGTYAFNTNLPSGTHAYYFSFTDGHGGLAQAPASGTTPGPVVTGPLNHAPIIDNPGVSPAEGTTDTTFTYTVRYSDQDGNSPSSALVIIDGTGHAMSLTSGSASNGIYTYSTVLSAGTHTYSFSFNDGNGAQVGLPYIDAYAGPFVNHRPALGSASVSPGSGTTATTFTYSVYYSDLDGHIPSARSVFIDGIEHAMTFATGQTPSNGVYVYQTALPPGSHSYYFLFSDGHGGSARTPASGALSGPLVNSPPALSAHGVSPGEGRASTTYTYSVHYADADGNSPASAFVYIDGTARTMSLASGTLSNGTYSFQCSLAPGTHTYYFSFADGIGGTARLPVSGSYSGPAVNHPPVLESAEVVPGEGTTATTFTFSVRFTDTDGDSPQSALVYIDGIAHTLTLVSGTASDGIYACQTQLAAQAHTYYFTFTDEHGDEARLPDTGHYAGPMVSPANIVYVDWEHGNSGNTGRSWSLAVPTIQEAIDRANALDEIWVRQGTYPLTGAIEINKAVKIYGGFDGTEHCLSQRDLLSHRVYVDGRGLVRCFSITGAANSVTIDGFFIENGNAAPGHGGGIYNPGTAASLNITNCTFRNNNACKGGGICIIGGSSNLTVANCMFENNSASTDQTGGGIYSSSAGTTIINSILCNNTAGGGGGIDCVDLETRIINCIFSNNSAYSPPNKTKGGGISIRNCTDAAITNCTVFGNTATHKGAGIYFENSTATVMNSIIRANSWGVYNKQIYPLNSTSSIDYCNVELGTYETPWGVHCIDEDPVFINPSVFDFHLGALSPCIDAGSNDAPGISATDLDGNGRIMGGTVDMGAYEFIY